jgi:hypothetical protein
MVSRGPKSTPYQNPKVTLGKPAIAILPEWKEAALGEHTTIDYILRYRDQTVIVVSEIGMLVDVGVC